MSRAKAFKKNLKFDMLAYFLTQILTFVNKILFVRFLGEELLGLNSLFASILAIISLAELGIGNVFNICLYKPLHEKNEEKIKAYLHFFKKAYKLIIIVISLIGIIVIPFFPFIMNTNISFIDVSLYYILYLIAILLTYFTMCESSLLFADQKHFIISKYQSIVLILQNVLQFIIIFFIKNYYLYLIIMIVSNLLYNYFIKKYVGKTYSYLYNKNDQCLSKEDKKYVFDNIKYMLVYKASCVALNATDNMLISTIINVATVGVYSIYTFISSALNSLIYVVTNSMAASVGNINTAETDEKKYEYYSKIQLVYFVIAGFCCVGLFAGSNDFIQMFFGDKYVLNAPILIVIILNFYIIQVSQPIMLFKETAGLFKEIRLANVMCALINLFLSIFLGKIYGLIGILAATFISRIATTFWYESKLVYKKVFNKNCLEFFLNSILILVITIVACLPMLLLDKIVVDSKIVSFILKEIVCCIVYFIITIIVFSKKIDFMYIKKMFRE